MAATAACNTYKQLLALRFLLGLFEGVTYPCIYLILNTLYRRSEQSRCWGFLGVATGAGLYKTYINLAKSYFLIWF